MGHQLVFWKQAPGNPPDPHSVYVQLLEGRRVAGLEPVAGDRFVARVAETLNADWRRIDERAWEGDGTVQIEAGPQHLLVIAHEVRYSVLNRLIDIGREFGCKLYDPQARHRFDDA